MHCNTSLFAAAALPVLQAAIRASIVALFAAESWEYPSRLAIRAVVPFVWEKEVEKTYFCVTRKRVFIKKSCMGFAFSKLCIVHCILRGPTVYLTMSLLRSE